MSVHQADRSNTERQRATTSPNFHQQQSPLSDRRLQFSYISRRFLGPVPKYSQIKQIKQERCKKKKMHRHVCYPLASKNKISIFKH